jgi:DNA ligase (NAD+)
MSQPVLPGPESDGDAGVAELEAAVRYHNHKYWVDNDAEIPDAEFDRLVERLRALAPDSPALDAIGPAGGLTAAEGEETLVGEKIEHTRPMLSLEKCYDDDTLLKWFDKFEGDAVASPKIDGVAVSLRYDASGELSVAATRGNGRVGEVITANARFVRDLPRRVEAGPIEVRGELYMPLSVFRSRFAQDFANPRNLTAGGIKLKDAEKTGQYDLRFMAYDLSSEALAADTEPQKDAELRRLGFVPVPKREVTRDDAGDAYRAFLAEREALDYETDGVVFRASRLAEQARMGATAHHPRYAIAYKYQGDSGTSVLRRVEWSVSRTGAINPVAIVDPVTLSGASVTRASLHNLAIMRRLGGETGLKLGSTVLMMRRGGVIPHVEEVLEWGTGEVEIPAACPSCGGATMEVDDVLQAEHRASCPATRLGALQHFVRVIDVRGFGPRILQQLIEADRVAEPADFFLLGVADLMALERVGKILAEKLVGEVQARRELPLDTFLRALGIDELGPHASGVLAGHYGSLEAVREAAPEAMAALFGIGPIIAARVADGLRERAAMVDRLLEQVTVEAPTVAPAAAAEGPLVGQSVLFTGELESMKRKEAQDRVRLLGGETPSAVVKDLTLLVLGDADLARFEAGWRSSKLKKVEALNAKGANIRVIGETEFLRLLEG